MDVVVRPAVAADAGRVADVYLASRRTHLPFAPLAHTESEVRAWIAGPLLASGGLFAVLVDGGVVGMLALSRADGAGWIDHLYLAPGWTGHGVGRAVLGFALGSLPRPVRLYAFEANRPARRFYERHGFRAVAHGDGSDNEEHLPDVLYELPPQPAPSTATSSTIR
jgi:GNAT superfamily N-acetyltransferase